MGSYYFLAPSLPPLKFNETPEITFDDLLSRMETNLKKRDTHKVASLRQWIDIENIRRLFLEKPLDARGNLSEKELDDALLSHEDLSESVYDYLHKYTLLSDRIRFFLELMTKYMQEQIDLEKGFVRRYFIFERELRLVLTALRSKLMKRDIAVELQHEEFSDRLVMQILAQKDADEYEPPREYSKVKEILHKCKDQPLVLHTKIEEFRFNQIEGMAEADLFSIDAILAYMAQLILIENLQVLNESQGVENWRLVMEKELQKK